MHQNLDAIARLRELLASLEKDLGLDTLSTNERAVLYAMQRIRNDSQREGSEPAIVRTEELRRHNLVEDMSQPTFNRAIKKLIEKKFLSPAPEMRVGAYTLGPKATPEDT